MSDNQDNVTEKEREKVIRNYFQRDGEKGRLCTLPSKEKKKLIIYKYIMKNFQADKKYTYQEVDQILKEIYDDYAAIRRGLIDYGFMKRTRDCMFYWVNNH